MSAAQWGEKTSMFLHLKLQLDSYSSINNSWLNTQTELRDWYTETSEDGLIRANRGDRMGERTKTGILDAVFHLLQQMQ